MRIENGPDNILEYKLSCGLNHVSSLTLYSGSRPNRDKVDCVMDGQVLFEGTLSQTRFLRGRFVSEYTCVLDDLQMRRVWIPHQQVTLSHFLRSSIGLEAQFYGDFSQKLEYWPQLENADVFSQLVFLSQKYGFLFYSKGNGVIFLSSSYRSSGKTIDQVLDHDICVDTAVGTIDCVEVYEFNSTSLEYETKVNKLYESDFAQCRMNTRIFAQKKYEGLNEGFMQKNRMERSSTFLSSQAIVVGQFFKVEDKSFICASIQSQSDFYNRYFIAGIEVDDV